MPTLIQRILDGDTQAFRKIIREHGPGVRVFLAGHIRDRHLAEDLAQEIFVAVYCNLKSFDQNQPLGPWIRTIAKNKLMSHLRRLYSQKSSVHANTVEIHEMLFPESDNYNPDTEAVIEQLRRCVAKHPEKDRQLIQARYFENEPVNGIAERLQTTVSAISSQLYRLRGQLRECIERSVAL